MAISFYLDQHVPRAIAIGLRMRGVDVLTTQDDGGFFVKALGSRNTEGRTSPGSVIQHGIIQI